MSRPEPAYRRSWTKVRNIRAEYNFRQLIRHHDLSGVPTVLVRQFAAISVRAHQLDREIANIEKRVQLVTDMDDVTFTRWCYLTSEYRRYADSVDKLAKAVFGNEHRAPSLDLVAAMAQHIDAPEPVEPEQPESETPEGDSKPE
jgi:hypothetical protein